MSTNADCIEWSMVTKAVIITESLIFLSKRKSEERGTIAAKLPAATTHVELKLMTDC